MPKLEITPRERNALRAAAHPLRPVVLIGDAGLSAAVLKEIELNLNAHSLIKVRAGGQDRDAREAMLTEICDTLSCANVHHLGKMLIIYRPVPGRDIPGLTPEKSSAKRRASEPHTPKKLAAEGRVLTKHDARAMRRAEAEATPANQKSARERVGLLNKSGKPVRPSAHKIEVARAVAPKRVGSALSLRAGASKSLTGGLRRTLGGPKK